VEGYRAIQHLPTANGTRHYPAQGLTSQPFRDGLLSLSLLKKQNRQLPRSILDITLSLDIMYQATARSPYHQTVMSAVSHPTTIKKSHFDKMRVFHAEHLKGQHCQNLTVVFTEYIQWTNIQSPVILTIGQLIDGSKIVDRTTNRDFIVGTIEHDTRTIGGSDHEPRRVTCPPIFVRHK
jgi:hypothetical protein